MSGNTLSARIVPFIKKTLPRPLRDRLKAVLDKYYYKEAASSDYRILPGETGSAAAIGDKSAGWQEPSVAEKQYAAFKPLLEEMRHGRPREDFTALASAVRTTGLSHPSIIEVGCGNGWNSEVISFLLKIPIDYCGIDISQTMTLKGKKIYPGREFLLGDATSLPVKDQSCDILLSGTVLMHLLGYEDAVRESFRVTRRWCIFHTVPLMNRRETTMLEKRAYGQPAIEIIFNEKEFIRLVEACGFVVREVIDSLPYDLSDVLGEPTFTRTFICEARRA